MEKIYGYFAFPKLEGELGPRMKFRGKEVLNWSLNNYLGLGNHPEVRKADADAAAQYGMAYPMGARIMSDRQQNMKNWSVNLLLLLVNLMLFFSITATREWFSAIDAICGRNDVIVYDAESHACILDGVRLHMGKRFVFLHNNMESLRKQLEHATKLAEKQKGGVLVITEGVFGMAGDMGKLDEIAALKDEFSFRLLVDDAHGFGMMGKTSAGSGEHFGVQDKIDLYFATFAKAMAGIGGFDRLRKRYLLITCVTICVRRLMLKIIANANGHWWIKKAFENDLHKA